MSWEEYNDMYEKAQINGKCHMYVFDMKNSKEILKDEYIYNKLTDLLNLTYAKIQDLEKKRKIKILHMSEFLNVDNSRGDTIEPIHFMGDLLVFTTIRDSIYREEVYKLFKESKKELDLKHYQFHFADGYYETDNYIEANKEYFRGYCIAYLEDKSKNKDELI